MLRQPAFPASEFEQLRQLALTGIESQRSEPDAIAGNALARHTNIRPKGHVYYAATFDEQIAAYKAATLDEVKAFHRDFYGASHGQLTIVGDFDATEMAALAKELFGDWKSKTPYVRIATDYRDFPVISKSFETPDKANAVFLAYQPLKVLDKDRDYAALMLGARILGGTSKNRLFVRLREKDGLSYDARGSVSVGALDPAGSFSASAIYAPQNASRVETGFKEEIARILKDGITAEELEGSRKGWLDAWRSSRAVDSSLSSSIHGLQFYSRTMAWNADLEAKIKAVTVADVNRTLRRFLDLDKMIIVKAGDFANAKGKSDAKTKE
jgi:zinc protease